VDEILLFLFEKIKKGRMNSKRLDEWREAINIEFCAQALGQIEIP